MRAQHPQRPRCYPRHLAHLPHRIRQHTPAYVRIRQHTSAYVVMRAQHPQRPRCYPRHLAHLPYRIRQHTPAYVRIRQHTSAYFSDASTAHTHLTPRRLANASVMPPLAAPSLAACGSRARSARILISRASPEAAEAEQQRCSVVLQHRTLQCRAAL
jgi:acyl-CoA thioesterase